MAEDKQFRICTEACANANLSDNITCYGCKLSYHLKCYGLSKSSTKNLTECKNLQFLCDKCVHALGSKSSVAAVYKNVVTLTNNVLEMKEMVASIGNTYNSQLSTDISSLKTMVSKISSSVENAALNAPPPIMFHNMVTSLDDLAKEIHVQSTSSASIEKESVSILRDIQISLSSKPVVENDDRGTAAILREIQN